jgi:hypothetical protein
VRDEPSGRGSREGEVFSRMVLPAGARLSSPSRPSRGEGKVETARLSLGNGSEVSSLAFDPPSGRVKCSRCLPTAKLGWLQTKSGDYKPPLQSDYRPHSSSLMRSLERGADGSVATAGDDHSFTSNSASIASSSAPAPAAALAPPPPSAAAALLRS